MRWGCREPADRYLGDRLVDDGLRVRSGVGGHGRGDAGGAEPQRRPDRPGGDTDNADAVACVLVGEADGHVVHCGLACAVSVDGGAGKVTVHARDVDDDAATLDEVRERYTARANRRHQVQFENLSPVRVGLLGEACRDTSAADVVDEDVQ